MAFEGLRLAREMGGAVAAASAPSPVMEGVSAHEEWVLIPPVGRIARLSYGPLVAGNLALERADGVPYVLGEDYLEGHDPPGFENLRMPAGNRALASYFHHGTDEAGGGSSAAARTGDAGDGPRLATLLKMGVS